MPAGVLRFGLNPQQLLAVVPLVERLRFVEPFVALQPHQLAAERLGQRLGQLCLADAGRTFNKNWFAKLDREKGD